MMKTPDEIKKGLERCKDCQSCTEYSEPKCPYNDVYECVDALLDDAFAYILQLEAERDAMLSDMSCYAMCAACKHGEDGHDKNCPYKDDCLYGTKGHFEWRGVQKEDFNGTA
jgi:hypothetical protein